MADLFRGLYRIGGGTVDFGAIRLHRTGADGVCRALGALALTVGSDIYFRDGVFAPYTPAGLRLLAHEVAHVVQQHRGPVASRSYTGGGLAVAPAGSAEEREADAAAEAVLMGRPFCFSSASPRAAGPGQVVQRYMAWEHCLLGDAAPGLEPLEEQIALLELLGRSPRDVDVERLHAEHPGVETVRLPGSDLVLTLGELNVLPDYLSHPHDIETASAQLLEPLIQSIRTWSITELRRSVGQPARAPRLSAALRYPRRRRFVELREAIEVDALGRRCGLPPWELYSSVVGRNAGHFAPFSWYRWQSFHLVARGLAARAATAPIEQRGELRAKARIHAGYADHFLQDSYAAGHLINKTLVMQWYLEWLARSPLPFTDRRLLAALTSDRQPELHAPGHYDPVPDPFEGRMVPRADLTSVAVQDPQCTADGLNLAARIEASGVVGATERERREAYAGYLALLGSSVAQLAAGVVHGYFNKHSLVVAAGPDGERYRLQGDRTLLDGAEGTARAAQAAAASRRAISELLRGGTEVTSREIFECFPDHVEQDGRLLGLREWHDSGLRALCFDELFGRWSTRATKLFLSVASRRFGVPSADVEVLRADRPR